MIPWMAVNEPQFMASWRGTHVQVTACFEAFVVHHVSKIGHSFHVETTGRLLKSCHVAQSIVALAGGEPDVYVLPTLQTSSAMRRRQT